MSLLIFEQDLKTIFNKYLFLIKLISVSLIISYLGYKIYSNSSLTHLSFYKNYQIKFVGWAMLLTMLNWGIEAKKWQLLIKNIKQLSFLESYQSVLAGLSIGIVTPNRLGNFIGRLAWVEKEKHNQATVNTLLGNLAQFISTIIFGCIGLFVVLWYQFKIEYDWMILLGALLVIIISLSIYFNPLLIQKTFLKQILNHQTTQSLLNASIVSTAFKLQIIALSSLRYVVFLIQYFLLFKAFNVEIKLTLMLGLISTVYLLTTLIPSIFFGKLFVRESVAVFVFSFIGLNTPLILLVAFILWLINLAIPSAIGGLIWLKKSKNK